MLESFIQLIRILIGVTSIFLFLGYLIHGWFLPSKLRTIQIRLISFDTLAAVALIIFCAATYLGLFEVKNNYMLEIQFIILLYFLFYTIYKIVVFKQF